MDEDVAQFFRKKAAGKKKRCGYSIDFIAERMRETELRQQQEDYFVEVQAVNSLIHTDQVEENDEWIQPTYTDVLDIASENLNCAEDATTKFDDDAQVTTVDQSTPDAEENKASEKKARKIREWGSLPETPLAPPPMVVVEKPAVEKDNTKYVVGAMKSKKLHGLEGVKPDISSEEAFPSLDDAAKIEEKQQEERKREEAERKLREEKLRQIEEKKKEDKERYLRESQRIREEMTKEKAIGKEKRDVEEELEKEGAKEMEKDKGEKMLSYVPPHMRKKSCEFRK